MGYNKLFFIAIYINNIIFMKVDEVSKKSSTKKLVTTINNELNELNESYESSDINSNFEGETPKSESNDIVLENKSNSKYDYNKKMELVKKISKIKKKEYLINIFKIITSENKDYTENTNGVFIFFHNLSDDVYDKLENYVNYIYKIHNKNNQNISVLSDSLNSINVSELLEISSSFPDINKNLSNKEKMLLRRRNYEEYINFNQQ